MIGESVPLTVDIQSALKEGICKELPASEVLSAWACRAYRCVSNEPAELSVLLVGSEQGMQLNREYRNKAAPTNVLSFPADTVLPDGMVILGDIVICIPVVVNEAEAEGKTLADHMAHMVVHGLLHLLGYDHIEEAEAERMESLEIMLLQELGIKNPYAVQ